MAKKDGKKVMGLETIQMQINAMYGSLNMLRQIELLHEAVNEKDGLRKMVGSMNKACISQNLGGLQDLMYAGSYKPEEIKALPDDRNNYRMQQLPELMKQQSLFVAAGALHLPGQSGLVQQLRNKGYTVTAVNLY
jgi:uncharacterized protein YbaP (TraB family)